MIHPAPETDPALATSDDTANVPAGDASRFTGDPGAVTENHRATMTSEPPNSRYKCMTAMSLAHGQWLRRLRQAHGWSIAQMVNRLRDAASAAGDKPPARESMIGMISRWENGRSGVSEQYRLRYCAAFKIPVDRFGDPSILGTLHANGISQYGAGDVPRAWRRSAWDRMQAALTHVGESAERDQLCFQLGYLSALMIMDEPAATLTISSLPAPAGDTDQT